MADLAPMGPINSVGELQQFHAETERNFAELLLTPCEIRPDDTNWHKRSIGGEVAFYLRENTKHHQYFADRAGGRGPCPIVAAKQSNQNWKEGQRSWVSWREVWTRRPTGFTLKEASFTFFWGLAVIGENLSNQLFRAEWPQAREDGYKAAMPHWQVDWPLANLVDVVSGIHFGMAGWMCGDVGQGNLARHWRTVVGQDQPS